MNDDYVEVEDNGDWGPMRNNLTPTIGGGGNREEQQIERININKRKDNNNISNTCNQVKVYLAF